MASLGNNDALLLLANVALANYAQEQQLAHAGATQGAVVDNTPPASQSANSASANSASANSASANSASSEVGLFDDPQGDGQQLALTLGSFDDYSTEDEQQTSTQKADSTDASSPTQAASSQGFTPIDPAVLTGGFTPRMTRSRTRHAATPIGPSGGRQPVTKKWQKTKPRTTGFNRQTGEGIYTEVCGIVTPAKGKPKAVKKETSEKSRYGCPRCKGRFTRARTVKDHFIRCVRDYGNPKGLCWYDHPTLSGSKDWALDQMGMKDDDNEVEGDGDEYEQDAEQDHDAESEHGEDDENEVEGDDDEYEHDAEHDHGAEPEHGDDYSGGQECGDEQGYDNEDEHEYEQDGNIAQAGQSDNTAVEEYQGPYNSMYA